VNYDHRSSLGCRKILAGLGTATVGAVAANVVGGVTAPAVETPVIAVVPSISVFDVNESLLDTGVRIHAPKLIQLVAATEEIQRRPETPIISSGLPPILAFHVIRYDSVQSTSKTRVKTSVYGWSLGAPGYDRLSRVEVANAKVGMHADGGGLYWKRRDAFFSARRLCSNPKCCGDFASEYRPVVGVKEELGTRHQMALNHRALSYQRVPAFLCHLRVSNAQPAKRAGIRMACPDGFA
jgi:hypothetical protein